MHLGPGTALYSVIPYIAPLLKELGWVSSRQSSGSGAWMRTFPSPLGEFFHMLTSAVGSLSQSRSIPAINAAYGRRVKPEIMLT